MHSHNITDILFCEFIIFVDFVDFVVHVKRKNYNPTKYNVPIDW